jgi:hypothetical protein
MQLFLILLMICLAGGFVITSLIWILFWATGILECPKELRAILGLSPALNHQHVESRFPVSLSVRGGVQIGRSNPGLAQIENSPFGDVRGASATYPVLTESSHLQNTGHYVATRY